MHAYLDIGGLKDSVQWQQKFDFPVFVEYTIKENGRRVENTLRRKLIAHLTTNFLEVLLSAATGMNLNGIV